MPYNRCHYALSLIVALILLNGQGTCANESQMVLMLASLAEQDTQHRITEAMVDQFMDSDIRFQVHWVHTVPGGLSEQEQLAQDVAANTDAAVVFWLDPEAAKRVYFYLSTDAGKQIFVRPLKGIGEEGLVDGIALICKSAVEAALAGEETGFFSSKARTDESNRDSVSPDSVLAETNSNKSPSKNSPVPSPPSLTPPKVGLSVDAFYSLSILSTDGDIQHGAGLSLSARLSTWFRIFVGYTFCQTLKDNLEYAVIHLKRHPIHLGGAVRHGMGRWSWEFLGSVVFDPLSQETIALQDNIAITKPHTQLGISILPAFRIAIAISGEFSFFSSVGAEIHLIERRYYFENGAAFFENQFRVQPYTQVGMQINF